MKEIQLTQGRVTLVDDEDFEHLNQFRWHISSNGYAKNKKYGFMHRFILKTPCDMVTDHINGDRLDNRKTNLRAVTSAQNSWNRKTFGNVPYIGVVLHIVRRKYKQKVYVCTRYMAKIKHEGRDIYLGQYKTPEDAAIAYNKAALLHRGEFAKLNIIQ